MWLPPICTSPPLPSPPLPSHRPLCLLSTSLPASATAVAWVPFSHHHVLFVPHRAFVRNARLPLLTGTRTRRAGERRVCEIGDRDGQDACVCDPHAQHDPEAQAGMRDAALGLWSPRRCGTPLPPAPISVWRSQRVSFLTCSTFATSFLFLHLSFRILPSFSHSSSILSIYLLLAFFFYPLHLSFFLHSSLLY